MLYNIFKAFWVGGVICVIAQIIIDKTKLTPARIMVSYVVAGAILTLIGIYEPIVKYAGAGATVPIIGFGYSLCKGVIKAVNEKGLIGVMIGGITATAGGITAAILFGYLAALLSKPRLK
ncbi:MAG: stage V sporulation protein AE [Clostridia bacterium]|nr:stage V sporulation protein AE [Oscillospiraceae bacterium]MDY5626651.1 stage V sporulation protein AE [Clostridia bacterium]